MCPCLERRLQRQVKARCVLDADFPHAHCLTKCHFPRRSHNSNMCAILPTGRAWGFGGDVERAFTFYRIVHENCLSHAYLLFHEHVLDFELSVFLRKHVNYAFALAGSLRYDIMCLRDVGHDVWMFVFPRTAATAAQSCRDRHGGTERLGYKPVEEVWHSVSWNTKTECKRPQGWWIYCRECKYTSETD